ncbi:hypothetical protein P43SY_011800 [Pythium insidiosum]|uniref:Uncharacterized protein n=1 Tax=Pythium insidiosum TaxID=114742 RepID=A0AAD5Q0Q4_PYTIN|nr:hypothetical protein P43SY_011800 [Pythium insidiosum]
MDHDGDIDMVAPPVFEFIKAPRLAAWSQQALVAFQRERRQYEEKMRERCVATGEVPERVVVSVKSTIDARVMGHLSRYVFKRSVYEITDPEVCAAISQKTGSLMNNHAPDVEQLVESKLKMDL